MGCKSTLNLYITALYPLVCFAEKESVGVHDGFLLARAACSTLVYYVERLIMKTI